MRRWQFESQTRSWNWDSENFSLGLGLETDTQKIWVSDQVSKLRLWKFQSRTRSRNAKVGLADPCCTPDSWSFSYCDKEKQGLGQKLEFENLAISFHWVELDWGSAIGLLKKLNWSMSGFGLNFLLRILNWGCFCKLSLLDIIELYIRCIIFTHILFLQENPALPSVFLDNFSLLVYNT